MAAAGGCFPPHFHMGVSFASFAAPSHEGAYEGTSTESTAMRAGHDCVRSGCIASLPDGNAPHGIDATAK